ncbi:hypothetical protein [Thiosulfativibrio zosterae]|uniref:Uncharacterized protein n=1 Tax=Thiosulfativibrio zosterae TaxID=2675053 RepID=A0A6F8PQA7_9GAMM|nr:hypothetical protein [Thiosulfativibrio zosterae]BBP44299.1 hypothetical protein THMIRHAT_20450 [Thiosulfativibrio zosterae]
MHPTICSRASVNLKEQFKSLFSVSSSNITSPYQTSVSIDMLDELSIPSLFALLSHASPSYIDAGQLLVSTRHLASTDESDGRSYNVFTRLSSSERKLLGYYNYDISSCLQIVSFGLLYRYSSNPELFSDYCLVFNYAWDTDFKRSFRQQISNDIVIDESDVKKELTAFANGKRNSHLEHPMLEMFQQQSDRLRREVLALIFTYEPDVFAIALSQSRKDLPDNVNWIDIEAPEEPALAYAKSSVFFFVWTYYEKQIRDAMLSLVDDGIPLHDAIYSRRIVSPDTFEKAIFDQTGFEVKIA